MEKYAWKATINEGCLGEYKRRHNALPDDMNNTRIEVLDKSESVDLGQTYVFNGKLRFKSEGYGFLVVRLYK